MHNNILLVIIVTYNGMKWLDKCLSSVINSTIKADLFIVDNGSTDGSIEFIENNYPNAQFIISKENLGFGKANNIGFQYAIDHQYDYVYLLNQDAWVEPMTLETLIQIHQQDNKFGILSPLQVNREKTRLDKAFATCCNQEMLSDILMHQPLKSIYETYFVMAAHWFISRECLTTVGGFSPAFPHYGEDNNYIHRAKYFGYKIGISPMAQAIHDREYREIPTEKRLHLYYVTWIYILSNPLLKKKAKFGKLIISIINSMYIAPSKAMVKFINIFHKYHKIAQIKKQSYSKGAFLDIHNQIIKVDV